MPEQSCWSEWLTYFIVCLCTTSHWCASFVRFASLQLIVPSRRAVHLSSLAHISSQQNDRWRGKQKPNSDGQIKSIACVSARQMNKRCKEKERTSKRSTACVHYCSTDYCTYPPSVIHYRKLHPAREKATRHTSTHKLSTELLTKVE